MYRYRLHRTLNLTWLFFGERFILAAIFKKLSASTVVHESHNEREKKSFIGSIRRELAMETHTRSVLPPTDLNELLDI